MEIKEQIKELVQSLQGDSIELAIALTLGQGWSKEEIVEHIANQPFDHEQLTTLWGRPDPFATVQVYGYWIDFYKSPKSYGKQYWIANTDKLLQAIDYYLHLATTPH